MSNPAINLTEESWKRAERTMNLEQLRTLVAQGESESLEFKRTTGQRSEAFKTVCAMLNGTLPGFVIFGVTNDGQIIGQDVTPNTHEQLANECRRIEPPAFPDIVTVPVDDRRSATGDPHRTGAHWACVAQSNSQ